MICPTKVKINICYINEIFPRKVKIAGPKEVIDKINTISTIKYDLNEVSDEIKSNLI